MDAKKNFFFSKWYADVIDEQTANVTIVYMGEIEWNFLKLNFTNILQFIDKHQLISQATFSNYRAPQWDEDIFRINTMDRTGQWQSKRNAIVEKLYENSDGYILWECVMPHALGTIEIDEKFNRGLGYVEKLTMTIKPWQIPIEILRWGRFLSENQTIVWIHWEGEEHRCFIFHNDRKYIDGIINDEMIEFENYRLVLAKKYILRNGPLIKTVFDRFSWVKKVFPSGLFDMHECKWQTWSELYEKDSLIAQDWSIHENVDCKPKRKIWGKIFYGFLFTILLPLVLIIWSKHTEKYIHLPLPIHSIWTNIFILIGVLLMSLAMLDLWIKGNGLPMNAYPPPKLVTSGVYRIFSHPIYIGASMLSFALSVYYQSRSGFWLVSPVLTLSWLALVYGYENEDLKKRFPDSIWKPLIHIPENLPIIRQWDDILSAYCLVLIPWLVLYQMIIFIGPPTHSLSTYLSWDDHIPVIEWTELLYLLDYSYVACLPLILQTKEQIRSFMMTGLMNIGIGIYCQLIFPLIAAPKEFTPRTIFGEILLQERELDGPNGAFPSFHVSWAFISAYYYTWIFPQWNFVFYLLAVLISVSCITTGMHSILDVLAGLGLFLLCIRRESIWIICRNYFERLGNSWSAWRIGPLRIINYSLYVFFGAFVGYLILFSLLGHITAVVFVTWLALFCASIWAQWIEQSAGLSRPFGFFGCITGGVIGSILVSWCCSIPLIAILAAYALTTPWLVAIGRFRCIIQGCCHGRPTSRYLGILITHPRSRVCSLSKLGSTYIHITAAYSILANILVGMLLWRWWYSNVSLHLIISLYFILIGFSRFVEETFRGEIQTPIYYQLKIYQWLSILFVLAGILISCIPCDERTRLEFRWKYQYIIPSICFGLVVAFIMAVDFPESKKRFSKLSD